MELEGAPHPSRLLRRVGSYALARKNLFSLLFRFLAPLAPNQTLTLPLHKY
jgi:hypothetical protein